MHSLLSDEVLKAVASITFKLSVWQNLGFPMGTKKVTEWLDNGTATCSEAEGGAVLL